MSEPITLRQAARQLKVSISTLRRKVLAGEVPANRILGPFGEQWVLSPSALDELSRLVQAERQSSERLLSKPPSSKNESRFVQWPGGEPFTSSWPVANELTEGLEETTPTGSPAFRTTPLHPGIPLEVHQQTLHLLEQAHAERREAQETAQRCERQLLGLRVELSQYQRALTEAAESMAEKRASDRAQLTALHQVEPSDQVSIPRAARLGWGSRFRRWLVGEQTG